jgi:hypothetical protein
MILKQLYSKKGKKPLKQKGGDPDDYDTGTAVLKYGALIFAFISVCCVIIYLLMNPSTIASNFSKYFFIVLFVLIMIFTVVLNIGEDQESTTLFFKITFGFLTIGYLVYLFSVLGSKIPSMDLYISYGLYALIGFIGLAIGYRLFMKYLSKLTGWYGFLAQLIFYIPCMMYDALYWTLDQFKLTPMVVYFLILIEFILILVYFYLPYLVTKAVMDPTKSTLLVNNPIPLNKGKQTLTTADKIMIPNESNSFRQNYAISMWVYTNPKNAANLAYTKESEIFNYGFTSYTLKITEANSESTVHILKPEQVQSVIKDPASGRVMLTDMSGHSFPILPDVKKIPYQVVKPMIRYYSGGGSDKRDVHEERDKFIFYFSEYPPSQKIYDPSFNYPMDKNEYDLDSKTFYEIEIPHQKWNQIVMNYNRNVVDIFINGNLERSFKMNDGIMPQYNALDSITVGDDNGIEGAVCNVVYYHHPLNAEDVANSYNLFMNFNPPINKDVIDPYQNTPGSTSN